MSSEGPAHSWERAVFAALALLLALPVLAVTWPAMADLPQHAAQLQILLDWHAADLGGVHQYPATYRIDLFTPYLLAYVPVWLLAQLMPLTWALELVIALALVALPWAARRLLRRVGAPLDFAWLVFPLALSYSFHWGFLNFLLATPLVLLFVELCVVHAAAAKRRTGLAIAVAATLLFFAHGIVGGLACLVGGGLATLRLGAAAETIPPRHWAATLLPFAAPLPFLLLWAVRAGGQMPAHGDLTLWAVGWHRLVELPSAMMGWPGSARHGWLGLGLLALPFLLGARPSLRAWRWWPFAVCAALALLWPEVFLTTSRVPGRFAVFLLPFLLVALEPGELPRRGRLPSRLAMAVAACLLVAQAVDAYLWQQQTRPFAAVLDAIPEGRSVLSLDLVRGSEYSPAPVTMSLAQWYMVHGRGARVDPSFAVQYPVVVRYRDEAIPDLPVVFAWRPDLFDWRHHGARYDYFLVTAPEDPAPGLFPPGAVAQVRAAPPFYLYRSLR